MPVPNFDRVQVVKWESSSMGGSENDVIPVGINECEDTLSAIGIYLQKEAGPADKEVLVWRDGNDIKLQDKSVGPYSLSQIITDARHLILDSLVHNIDESCTEVVTRTDGKVTKITFQTIADTPIKIREVIITRSVGKVSQLEITQYDATGNWLEKLTGTVSRSSGKISSIAWTRTVP